MISFKLILFIFCSLILLCNTYSIDVSNSLKKRKATSEGFFTFKVLSFTEKQYNVYLIYDGIKYLMTPEIYPLYTYQMKISQMSSTDDIQYHFAIYEKNDKNENLIDEEEFQRFFSFNISNKSTYNHIFKNNVDFFNIKRVPRVYESFPYTVPSELFDDRFVATIILNLDEQNTVLLNQYHQNPSKNLSDLKADMTYVSPFAVKNFKDVSLNLSGDRSINNRKLSYKIKDIEGSDGEGLYKRKSLKLRANQDDFSFIREKLVYTLNDSLGIPTQGCTFVRLIINDKSIGLFTLIDHISNNGFLKEVFNNGKKFDEKKDAVLFKVDNLPKGIDGTMRYFDDDPTNEKYNSFSLKKSSYCKNNDEKVEKHEYDVKKNQLIPLFKKINDLTLDDISSFEGLFNVEAFLRSVVVDYLCQGVDNYLFWGDNYYLFKNANKKDNDYRWHFISTDFHFTFGSDGFTQQLRDTFFNQVNYNTDMENKVRQPLTKLLELDSQTYTNKINTIIKSTLEKVYNPHVFFPYIDSIVEMIKNDVKWDLMQDRVNPNGNIIKSGNYYDYFTENVKDKENFEIYPLPVKAFINQRAKYSANEVGAILPSSNDTVDVGILGYTEPKFAKYFVDDFSAGYSFLYRGIGPFTLIILILSSLFMYYY